MQRKSRLHTTNGSVYWRGKFHAGDWPDLTGGVGHPGPLKRASSIKFAAALLGKADRRGNLYPTKTRPDQKIDVAVALMMAIGRAMVEDEQAKGWTDFSLIRSLVSFQAGLHRFQNPATRRREQP